MNKFISFFYPETAGDKRASRVFSITAVILVIIVLLNVFAGTLDENVTQFDISGNNAYRISDVSKDVVSGLEHDIELIMVINGDPDARVNKFVHKYAAMSGRISVSTVNPAKDSTVLSKYGCTNNQLVIHCPDTGKSTSVNMTGISDALLIMSQDPYSLTATPTYMDADSHITGAILQVTGNVSEAAYFIDGHGEVEFPANASSMIEKNNIAISESKINLLMTEGGIPDDCSMLIDYCPTSDLADDEIEIISNYLQSGGNFTLISNDSEFPNYNKLLAEYGLEMQYGIVGDVQNYYYNYVNYYGYFCIYPELSSISPVTKNISSPAMMIYPFGMKEIAPARDTITVDAFMTTSDNGILLVDENTLVEQNKAILGAVVTEDLGDKKSSFTVFSAASLIDDTITSAYTSMSNLDIFINGLTANLEVEAVAISPISLNATYNTITNSSVIKVVLMYVLPLIIIIYGVIYCLKRRKR